MEPMKHDRVLFLRETGESMHFYMPPCQVRARIKPLIEHGGGIINAQLTEDSIKLALEFQKVHCNDYIRVAFIDDCVQQNKIVDMEKYRLNSGEVNTSRDDSSVSETDGEGGNNHIMTFDPRHHSGRTGYMLAEDMAIIRFLIDESEYNSTGGNKVWQKMEILMVTKHTWQSMKDRFRKKILPLISTYHLKRREVALLTGTLNLPSDGSDGEKSPRAKKSKSEAPSTSGEQPVKRKLFGNGKTSEKKSKAKPNKPELCMMSESSEGPLGPPTPEDSDVSDSGKTIALTAEADLDDLDQMLLEHAGLMDSPSGKPTKGQSPAKCVGQQHGTKQNVKDKSPNDIQRPHKKGIPSKNSKTKSDSANSPQKKGSPNKSKADTPSKNLRIRSSPANSPQKGRSPSGKIQTGKASNLPTPEKNAQQRSVEHGQVEAENSDDTRTDKKSSEQDEQGPTAARMPESPSKHVRDSPARKTRTDKKSSEQDEQGPTATRMPESPSKHVRDSPARKARTNKKSSEQDEQGPTAVRIPESPSKHVRDSPARKTRNSAAKEQPTIQSKGRNGKRPKKNQGREDEAQEVGIEVESVEESTVSTKPDGRRDTRTEYGNGITESDDSSNSEDIFPELSDMAVTRLRYGKVDASGSGHELNYVENAEDSIEDLPSLAGSSPKNGETANVGEEEEEEEEEEENSERCTRKTRSNQNKRKLSASTSTEVEDPEPKRRTAPPVSGDQGSHLKLRDFILDSQASQPVPEEENSPRHDTIDLAKYRKKRKIIQNITEWLDITCEELLHVLWTTSGVLSDAVNWILDETSVLVWSRKEDDLLQSGDEAGFQTLLKKFGQNAVNRRTVFLEENLD